MTSSKWSAGAWRRRTGVKTVGEVDEVSEWFNHLPMPRDPPPGLISSTHVFFQLRFRGSEESL